MKLIQPSDDPVKVVDQPALLLMVQEFKVSAWNDKQIVAIAQPRAADIFLTISIKQRSAERVSKETEARGAVGARKTVDS